MSNHYTPFDQYPPKPLWDEVIRDNGDTCERWLYNCNTVIGMWWLSKMLTLKEFLEAGEEIKDLCRQARLDHLCIHCSSRATVHDCSKCSNKGEKNEAQ